jgi:hypothetical protein
MANEAPLEGKSKLLHKYIIPNIILMMMMMMMMMMMIILM